MGRATLLATALLVSVGTGTAHATATAEVIDDATRTVVTDSPGEDFGVEFLPAGNFRSGFILRSGALTAGPGCRQYDLDDVVCDQPRGNPVELLLGDGNDVMRAERYRYPLLADAGSGNDRLQSGRGRGDRLQGGDGDDEIDSQDLLFGARGIGYPRPARDSVTCGPGEDRARVDALDVVAPDCEHVTYYGTSGVDRLHGDDRAETFLGRGGDDLIIGGGGSDEIHGERGDDRIDARDGERDTIRCGQGRDRVRADRADVFPRDADIRTGRCERVVRR